MMKKLIKLAIIVVAVLVLAFSSNPTIVKVRTTVKKVFVKSSEVGEKVYNEVIKEQEEKVVAKIKE